MDIDVSIITVTWNSAEKISDQISSVRLACKKYTFEHFIIDNASTDDTVSLVKKDFPHIQLIENKKNMGFGYPHNQAAAVSRGRYFLLLNPDMRLTPGSIDTLVAWMDKKTDVGIVGPKLVDPDGVIVKEAAPRRFPRVWEHTALLFGFARVFPGVLDGYLMKGFGFDKEQEVDSVRGSFMLMRRTVYNTLGWVFDPRYFIWYEDVDLCREVKKMGMKIVYTPIVSCVDYVGQSFKKRDGFWKKKHFTQSMLVYTKKWYPWYVWIWVALVRPAALLISFVYGKVSRNT
jgi:GT2 family glycosyltransferase